MELITVSSEGAAPLHTGPELQRAINRTDFFRLFKSAAQYHRFENFSLLRIGEAGHFSEREIVITNVADQRLPLFLDSARQSLSAFNARPAQGVTAPFSGRASLSDGHRDDIAHGEFLGSALVLIPLFTPEGRRYCLLLSGTREEPDEEEMADILLDGMRIFDRMHREILAQELSGRLTQRETEVVKWTSEGKTSADIAIILGLSEHTINSHITAAARKLDAVNRVHMVAIALRNGLVS